MFDLYEMNGMIIKNRAKMPDGSDRVLLYYPLNESLADFVATSESGDSERSSST